MNQTYNDSTKRHDFVFFFDVTDGNPNGDPDAGNLPRVDPENMHGLVTDVSLKRKIRDWVDLTHGSEEAYKIYVQNKGTALNDLHKRAYKALGIEDTGTKQKSDDVQKTRNWMCQNFYDIRTFGAVMTTAVNCGQVRGPVQLTFARSLDPIIPLDVSITRVAVTKAEDAQVQVSDDGKTSGKVTEMGRKSLVPYGLYRAQGFYSPHFAEQTGFDSEDLSLFWQALQSAWEIDRSSSRGMLAFRGLCIFTHENSLGNAPAHQLFERIQVKLDEGVDSPRRFTEYSGAIQSANLPEGVTLTVMGDIEAWEARVPAAAGSRSTF